MKKIFTILALLLILQCTTFANEKVQVFSENVYFGIKKEAVSIITKPTYKKLIRIGESAWLAQNKSKFGLISSDGTILVKTKYRHADRIMGKFAKLGNDNDYGIYDETGKAIISPEYSSIEPLFGNMFLIKKNYRYGVADINGKILLSTDYEDIYMPSRTTMRIKFEGEWFEVAKLSENEIILPENSRKITIDDKDFKITHLMTSTGAASGYSVITATDYTLKVFSSISPAYEQTIDELMLSQGAETVSIFMKLGWIPKFPFTYAKKYYQNLRNPYNGPLTDIKSDLKKKL
ncbi:WG repeat-containing protein [bacterium]|nr:WG repeat-containing protein [bacterium]